MVSHHALDLVELGQVCGVQGLVSEHAINGEVLGWREGFLGATGRPGPGVGQKADRIAPCLPLWVRSNHTFWARR